MRVDRCNTGGWSSPTAGDTASVAGRPQWPQNRKVGSIFQPQPGQWRSPPGEDCKSSWPHPWQKAKLLSFSRPQRGHCGLGMGGPTIYLRCHGGVKY